MKKEKSNNLLLIVVTILAVILFLNRGGRRERNDSLPAGAATSTPEVIAVPTAKPADPAAFPEVYAAPEVTPTNPTPAITERNWSACMTLPDNAAVEAFNAVSNNRSPYVTATADTSVCTRFTQYAIDFRADYLPTGTYCCLANFDLDYSALRQSYADYRMDYPGVAGYAGLQRGTNGRTNSIMSFWDVFCRDAAGRETVIRARQVAPASGENSDFDGEGTGVHCLIDYPWQAGRWYRMLLQCSVSETTGNTTIEQWVCDLGNMTWTSLCQYDLGVPNVTFQGNVATFLECFQHETAGNVRSMEIRNIRIADAYSGQWLNVQRVFCSTAYGYPGSYAYGADGHTVYMISTGLDGMAGYPQADMTYMISNLESGIPY